MVSFKSFYQVSYQFLSQDQIQEFKEAFNMIDHNRNGDIQFGFKIISIRIDLANQNVIFFAMFQLVKDVRCCSKQFAYIVKRLL